MKKKCECGGSYYVVHKTITAQVWPADQIKFRFINIPDVPIGKCDSCHELNLDSELFYPFIENFIKEYENEVDRFNVTNIC